MSSSRKPRSSNPVALRRLTYAALCWAVLNGAALAEAPARPAESQLTQAVAALRAISTLRADFIQTDANGAHVTGVLSMKRPGHIRFQYQPSYPMVVIADGRALVVIDTEAKHMQRWPIADSPLGALLDPARDVTRFGQLLPGSAASPNLVSIMVRDPAHREYGAITLIFERRATAPGGLELTAWVSLDAQNHRTFIHLANQRYGVAVPDELFRYSNPQAGPHH